MDRVAQLKLGVPPSDYQRTNSTEALACLCSVPSSLHDPARVPPVGAGSRSERRQGHPLSGEFDEQFRPTCRRPPRRGKREDLRLLTKHVLRNPKMRARKAAFLAALSRPPGGLA